MTNLVAAEGPILDRILDDTYEIWHDGLTRHAYGRFYAAQVATAWGRTHLQRFALVDGDDVLASAKLYTLRRDARRPADHGRRHRRRVHDPGGARPRRGARADRSAARAGGGRRRRSRAAVFGDRPRLLRAPRLRADRHARSPAARHRVDALRRADDHGPRRRRSRSEGHRRSGRRAGGAVPVSPEPRSRSGPVRDREKAAARRPRAAGRPRSCISSSPRKARPRSPTW